jgi:hypothetical protein
VSRAPVTAEVASTHTVDLRGPVDEAIVVRSMEELYAACRDAPPGSLVEVTLRGPDGDVRLHFASFSRTR